MTEDNTYERRDTGRAYGQANIGVFDRTVSTPDQELMEAEERGELTQKEERQIMLFMMKIFQWLEFPNPNLVHLWGFIFAFDLDGFIQGRSMSHIAKHIGVTRAAISHSTVAAAKIFGLHDTPSKNMRSRKTAKRNKTARIAHTRPQ